MKEESIRILGICGSPIKSGNVDYFLDQSLNAAKVHEGATVKKITLAGSEISECIHCNWCVDNASPEKFCALDDDMALFYPELIKADALLFATPVYIAKMSGLLACFIDRMRVFLAGKLRGSLKNKVAGALAVSWFRHGGAENTLLGIYASLLLFEVLLVSNHHADAFFGAAAHSSIEGTGKTDGEDRLLVKRDFWGVKAGQILVQRMIELSRIVKSGQKARMNAKQDLHILSISETSKKLERIRLSR